MLLLNLFDDVVIVVVFVPLDSLFETALANSEAGLSDDQIRVLLFLLNYFGGDVVVDEVVCARRGNVLLVVNHFPLNFRVEARRNLFNVIHGLWIIGAGSRLLFLLLLLRSGLG